MKFTTAIATGIMATVVVSQGDPPPEPTLTISIDDPEPTDDPDPTLTAIAIPTDDVRPSPKLTKGKWDGPVHARNWTNPAAFACKNITLRDPSKIVAVPFAKLGYEGDPNDSPLCGATVNVKKHEYPHDLSPGGEVNLTVMDVMPNFPWATEDYEIHVSPQVYDDVFKTVQDVPVINLKWWSDVPWDNTERKEVEKVEVTWKFI